MGGTTLAIMIPLMSEAESFSRAKRLWITTPYSSAVCSRLVASRQSARKVAPWYKPRTVLVFPTSITRMVVLAVVHGMIPLLLFHFHHFAGHQGFLAAVIVLDFQRAARVNAGGGGQRFARCGDHADALAVGKG